MPHTQLVKRTLSTLVVLLIAALGLIGIAATLFPPPGVVSTPMSTLLGLLFSALFLFVAWVIWRWSRSCLLCQTPESGRQPGSGSK